METVIDETILISRKDFRSNIFKAWGYSCAYCGSPANTLDHIHPKSKGGSQLASNLVSCCKDCKLHKGSEDLVSWYRDQPFWSADRELRIIQWQTYLLLKAEMDLHTRNSLSQT